MDVCTKVQTESQIVENAEKWKKVIGFTHDREYDYWATVKRSDESRPFRKRRQYKLKERMLAMFYSAENNDVELFSDDDFSSPPSSRSSSESDDMTVADLYLYTDVKTNSLCAERVSNNAVTIQYRSHCLRKGETGQIEYEEKANLFSFNDLFKDLYSRNDIEFDPSEATLIFKNKLGKDVCITIRSKAANVLFVSLVEYPFSGHYQTL